MAQGSLQTQLTALGDALKGIATLTGVAGENGFGLAGAASLTADASIGPDGVQVSIDAEVSVATAFDGDDAVANLTGVFGQLTADLNLNPASALTDFANRIKGLNGALDVGFIGNILDLVKSLEGLSGNLPENRSGVFALLVEQLLKVFSEIDGPQGQQIQVWIDGLKTQLDEYGPLILQAQNAANPAEILLGVISTALSDILEALGYPQISEALAFLDSVPGNLLPEVLLTNATASFDGLNLGFDALIGQANADPAAFNAALILRQNEMIALKQRLWDLVAVLRQIAALDLLAPGELERRLKQLMDRGMGVKVWENRKIDDPYKKLLDAIDAKIDEIDLTSARDAVLDFFEKLRSQIEKVDLSAMGTALDGGMDQLEGAVSGLQDGINNTVKQVQDYFDSLVGTLRNSLNSVGSFDAQNQFTFHFEKQLRDALETARIAVGGDPQNPDAPSVAGNLARFQTGVDNLISKLVPMLQPVETATAGVVDNAVSGIEDFVEQLGTLNIPGKIDILAAKVGEIVDALAPIDFAPIVDPIVAELDSNAEKLAQVNTDDLNDMLKMALSAALDVVIQIDFTVSISTPLKDEFAKVKEVPAQAIQLLQQQYENALSLLDNLQPEKLLEALLAAFDVIKAVIDQLDLVNLLEPLDKIHHEKLRQPLEALKPSLLLNPLTTYFQDLTGLFDQVNGQSLIGPLDDQLNQLKTKLTGLDLEAPLDALLAAVAKIKADLEEIRPSLLLQGLTETFTQLEAQIDRFKPSVVFAPVAELATPLLNLLENIQQETVDALFQLFAAPVQVLGRLEPQALETEIRGKVDLLLGLLTGLDLPNRFNGLKAKHFDMSAAVQAGGVSANLELSLLVDPQPHLGEIVEAYTQAVGEIQAFRDNLALPDLADLYGIFKDKLMAMLPPYARQALDTETFKRLMRLADPTRFLTELDQRFEAIKNKLLPIRPEQLGQELDTTYEAVLALVSQVDPSEQVQRLKQAVGKIKGIVDGIRIDFVAKDIDEALAAFKAVVAGLDPARLFGPLDSVHGEIMGVVDQTIPSTVLAGLQVPLDQIKAILNNLDPRNKLEKPLMDAWKAVLEALGQVDFTIVLQPILDKLDELEIEFEAGLKRTETAFDGMLSSGKKALGSSGSLSASASVSVSGGF